jgi:LmbE family N-acetylglucosaminyl deacetylase
MPDSPSQQQFTPREPICFISTHLDDVALSCSYFIAAHPGVTVITVCATAPDEDRREGWDYVTTGREYAPDAVRVRLNEDTEAMSALRALPRRLEFMDSQYMDGRLQDESAIANALVAGLSDLEPGSVVGPLGLHHSDHRAVSNACLTLAKGSKWESYVYADMPYLQTFPTVFDPRMDEIDAGGVELAELEPFRANGTTKQDVVSKYASQVEPLKSNHSGWNESMLDSERYWRVLRVNAHS